MLILGVECTAAPVSCAITENGKLKGEYFLNLKTTHSQTLLPMISSVLELTGMRLADIDAFAVSAGPGSFTGVRIGISAVKGMALPLGKPCIPVSVLEAMAQGFCGEDCYVCAVMDARCNQVYNAVFDLSGGTPLRLCDDRALMIDDLKSYLTELINTKISKKIIITGDGEALFYSAVKDSGLPVVPAPMHLVFQRAALVCSVAEKNFADGKTVSAAELLPFYLRLPQAERELRAKLHNNTERK